MDTSDNRPSRCFRMSDKEGAVYIIRFKYVDYIKARLSGSVSVYYKGTDRPNHFNGKIDVSPETAQMLQDAFEEYVNFYG